MGVHDPLKALGLDGAVDGERVVTGNTEYVIDPKSREPGHGVLGDCRVVGAHLLTTVRRFRRSIVGFVVHVDDGLPLFRVPSFLRTDFIQTGLAEVLLEVHLDIGERCEIRIRLECCEE